MADMSTMTREQLEAELARLMAERNTPRALTLKVSEKGAISIYGVGRFPVTVYRSQAERLFTPEFCTRMAEFIKANESKLSVKADK